MTDDGADGPKTTKDDDGVGMDDGTDDGADDEASDQDGADDGMG